MRKITKAVIPCAGFGTRFLPATKAIPKEMFPIIDTPSLQLIVQECVDSGITDILFIISEHKQCIKQNCYRRLGNNVRHVENNLKEPLSFQLHTFIGKPCCQ